MMLLSEFLLCDSWGQTYISNTQTYPSPRSSAGKSLVHVTGHLRGCSPESSNQRNGSTDFTTFALTKLTNTFEENLSRPLEGNFLALISRSSWLKPSRPKHVNITRIAALRTM